MPFGGNVISAWPASTRRCPSRLQHVVECRALARCEAHPGDLGAPVRRANVTSRVAQSRSGPSAGWAGSSGAMHVSVVMS